MGHPGVSMVGTTPPASCDDAGMTVDSSQMAAALGLTPHPEGGYYVETWRGPATGDGRSTGTAIYYLLEERSHWHRVDADELWLFHAGAPLTLSIAADGATPNDVELGPDIDAGQRPQALVPAGSWQSAVSAGPWTLVSCVVVPGFDFDGFELAPPGWSPSEWSPPAG